MILLVLLFGCGSLERHEKEFRCTCATLEASCSYLIDRKRINTK